MNTASTPNEDVIVLGLPSRLNVSDEHVLYGNVFNSVSGNASIAFRVLYIEKQLQLLKRFPYRFAMFHGRYGITKKRLEH